MFNLFVHLVVKPTRHEVLIQLACISALWHEIGDGLGVKYNDLDSLAQSNLKDQRKLGEVIEIWIKMDGKDGSAPVTWITILDLLKGPLINNKALAMKIYQSLKEEGTKEQIAPSKYTIDSSYCYINVLDSIQLII